MDIQNTNITKTQIASRLNSCKFDPKDTSDVINVAARSDKRYCVNRAIEAIITGNLTFAIQLLALAEEKDGE